MTFRVEVHERPDLGGRQYIWGDRIEFWLGDTKQVGVIDSIGDERLGKISESWGENVYEVREVTASFNGKPLQVILVRESEIVGIV